MKVLESRGCADARPSSGGGLMPPKCVARSHAQPVGGAGSSAALNALAELHQSASVANHLEAMRQQAALGGGAVDAYSLAQLGGARSLRKQLVVGVVVQLSMQLSGIDAIFLYSTLSLRLAGVADPLSDEDALNGRYAPMQPEAPPKIVKLITRKPKVPTAEEIDVNVRSRSAKLRVCEKL